MASTSQLRSASMQMIFVRGLAPGQGRWSSVGEAIDPDQLPQTRTTGNGYIRTPGSVAGEQVNQRPHAGRTKVPAGR